MGRIDWNKLGFKRDAIPWICFAIVICYGQWRTYRIGQVLEARGVWMQHVADIINERAEDRWTIEQMRQYVEYMREHNKTLELPPELPSYKPHRVAPRFTDELMKFFSE